MNFDGAISFFTKFPNEAGNYFVDLSQGGSILL